VSVAIVDYGSGNLHSAAKAFEARRARMRLRRADHGDPRSRPGRRCGTRRAARGRRLSRTVAAALDAVSGMVDALNMRGARPGAGRFWAFASACSSWPRRGREYEVTAGLGWIPGEVDRITPSDPGLKIPHMGWNTLNEVRPHKLLEGIPVGNRRACMPISCTRFISRPRIRRGLVAQADYGGPVTADRGARHGGRHPISSGEEPAARAQVDCEFPGLEAVILFPAIDLKGGACVRLEQGRHWRARDRVPNAIRPRRRRPSRSRASNICTFVDLDGAFAGKPVNAAAVDRILETTRISAAARRRHPGSGHRRGLARQRVSTG